MGITQGIGARMDGVGGIEVRFHHPRSPAHWLAVGTLHTQMTTKEIDDIYETTGLLIKKGRWSLLDNLIEFYADTAWRMPLDMLVTWATATLLVKSKLKSRKRFIDNCIKFHWNAKEPSLWKGLE